MWLVRRCRWQWHSWRRRRGFLLVPVLRFARKLADLEVVLGVIDLARLALRGAMLRMHAPGAHPLLGFELHDGDALAVVGEEALVRDVARHRGGKLVHALRQRHVFLAHA